MRRWFPRFALLLVVLVALAGCGGKGAQTPGTPPAPAGQPEPTESPSPRPVAAGSLTAKEACTRLAESARQWAGDARPYKLEGKAEGEGAAMADGRCPAWRVWFSSPTKKEIWVYSFKDGQPTRYPEGGGGNLSYEVADWSGDWQVDSDRAAQIAGEEGIKEVTSMKMYLRGAPFVTTPSQVPSSCNVYWDVYGRDAAGNGKRVYVDGTTGAVLK